MGKTSIEWCDHSWNPWQGCIKVSPGCKNCYMYREKKMYGQAPDIVVRSKTTFNDPLKWAKKPETAPQLCFTCSWSDFFIKEADEWRPEAWDIIRRTPEITYQILTKRHERMADCLPPDWGGGYPNVWLGVSVENPDTVSRVDRLLMTPAVVRFVSAEPLLDYIDIGGPLRGNPVQVGGGDPITHDMAMDAGDPEMEGMPYCDEVWEQTTPRLDWVVAGTESGPGMRFCDPHEIVLPLIEDCRSAGVPIFVKQLHLPNPSGKGFRLSKDIDEWPEDMRVRQFPAGFERRPK